MLISLTCANCDKTTMIGRGKLSHDTFEVSIPCPHCKAVYRVTIIQLRVGEENAKRDPNQVASTYLPDQSVVPVAEYGTKLAEFTKTNLPSNAIQSPKGVSEGKKIQSGS